MLKAIRCKFKENVYYHFKNKWNKKKSRTAVLSVYIKKSEVCREKRAGNLALINCVWFIGSNHERICARK